MFVLGLFTLFRHGISSRELPVAHSLVRVGVASPTPFTHTLTRYHSNRPRSQNDHERASYSHMALTNFDMELRVICQEMVPRFMLSQSREAKRIVSENDGVY